MRKTEWGKSIRILSATPVLILVLIGYVAFIMGKGDVSPPSSGIQAEMEKLEVPDNVDIENGRDRFLTDYTQIVEQNLFASSREEPSVRYSPEGRTNGSTTVSGDYVLLGVVVTGDDQSLAIIRKGGKGVEEKAYKIGDDIDNMVVEEIFYDRVILRQGEKENILELKPREDEKAKLPVKVPPTPQSRARKPTPRNLDR